MQKATATIFEIHDSFRVKNSPFFIEGTEVQFDVTHEIPLPNETISFTDGKPRPIRFLLDCDTIDKQEQIKLGFPADRAATDTERKLLTFIDGRLPVDIAHLDQFLKTAPWWDEYKGQRPPGTKIMYREHKQAQIEEQQLEREELVLNAKQLILKLNRTKATELLRLYNPAAIVSPHTELKTLKIRLLEIAEQDPEFISKGSKTAHDKVVILVSKAVDYQILNLDIAGILALVVNGQPTPLTKISDVGGKKAKLEKAVTFFESADGKTYLEDLTKRVTEYEALNIKDEEDESKEKDEKK